MGTPALLPAVKRCDAMLGVPYSGPAPCGETMRCDVGSAVFRRCSFASLVPFVLQFLSSASDHPSHWGLWAVPSLRGEVLKGSYLPVRAAVRVRSRRLATCVDDMGLKVRTASKA